MAKFGKLARLILSFKSSHRNRRYYDALEPRSLLGHPHWAGLLKNPDIVDVPGHFRLPLRSLFPRVCL